MKDKREFRIARGLDGWLLVFLGAALLLVGSFYLDRTVQAWIPKAGNVAARGFMQAVSRYGDWPEHIVLGSGLMGIAYWRGSKRWMRIFAAMILACALAGVGARVVKVATGRARPNVQTQSEWNGPRISARYNAFPSGHTAASTAFFGALAFASWRIGAGFLLIPLLIAFSRMYVAAHYFSDVVCVAIIGVVTAYVVVGWRPLQIENRRLKIEDG
ncbi:MAG TPA: phosphatase PAP2 family protein [Chthoniobacterales bacterium]